MKICQSLFDYYVPILIQFYKAVKLKHKNIYVHGRVTEFVYGDEDFRTRYNQVKNKHGGNADAEMMELYGEQSSYRIIMAMLWCLEQGEYIAFAMLFHQFRPMFVSCFAKQCIASYPEAFAAFHSIQKPDLTIMQIFYGMVLFFYAKFKGVTTPDKMAGDEILQLEKSVKEAGFLGLFFKSDNHEKFVQTHFDVDTHNLVHLDKYFALDRTQSNDYLDVADREETNMPVLADNLHPVQVLFGEGDDESMDDDSDSEFDDQQSNEEVVQDYSQQVAIFVSHDYGTAAFYA